jgi:hypothetical protein
LAAAFGSLLMGLWANYPIGLAPGMGQNFFVVLTVMPICATVTAPGVNTITLERDVLPFFDDDRVTASAFLQKHGFVVKEIDGEQQVVNAEAEST